MNVLTPGSACVHLLRRSRGSSATERRIGRSPVCSEKYLTCAGAVSQSRNFSACDTRLLPLLKITQLSGPEMV